MSFSIELGIESLPLREQLEMFIASYPDFGMRDRHDRNSPSIAILELDSSQPSQTFAEIKSLQKTDPDTEFFLTVDKVDVNVVLEALQTGIKEVFPLPLKKEQLDQALARFRQRFKERQPKELKAKGKLFSIVGSKAGVGTTTVAVNLAMALRQLDPSKSVVLMDLNLDGGEIPFFFSLKVEHGLTAIATAITKDPEGLDPTLLRSLVSSHASGLDILAIGNGENSVVNVSAECVEKTVKELLTLYDYVVVDCGYGVTMTNQPVFELATHILTISQINALPLRRTKILLDFLRNNGLGSEKIHLIVNGYSSSYSTALRDSEQFLQQKAYFLIPNDFEVTTRAINEGAPLDLAAPKAKITKCFRKLGASFLEDRQDKQDKNKKLIRMGNLFGFRRNNQQGESPVASKSFLRDSQFHPELQKLYGIGFLASERIL